MTADARTELATAETQASASSGAPGESLVRGARLGRYTILEQLGQGGMGVVYTAYDPELDRRVAIKLVRTAGAESSARLLREAQALARLSHPNVVGVFDVGTFGEAVFVAMEHVDGVTLSAWLRDDRERAQVVAMFTAAGRGLAAAHAAGLIHRDFKPDNVLVGKDGRPRVVDFGLARAAETVPAPLEGTVPPTAAVGDLTATGAIMGTPAYMAPEQFLGVPADARTDQFSFFVALYEALYGQRPFEGETFASLSMNVSQGKVRPAPARTSVPQKLRAVLLRGLRPSPDARHPSMEAVLRALAPFDLTAGQSRRNVILWTAGVSVALIVAIAIALPRLLPEPASALPWHEWKGTNDPLETRLIPISHADPEGIAHIARATVLSPRGRAAADPRNGNLIFTDDPRHVDLAQTLIQYLDEPGVDPRIPDELVGPAWAAPTATQGISPSEAAEHRRQAARAFTVGELGEAARHLRRAYDASRDPELLYSLMMTAFQATDYRLCADAGDLYLQQGKDRHKREVTEALRPFCFMQWSHGHWDSSFQEFTREMAQRCDEGDPSSCFQVGAILATAWLPEADGGDPRPFLGRACRGGHSQACAELGGLDLRAGRLALAAESLRAACDAERLYACWELGGLHERGEGVPRNPALAVRLYTRACAGADSADNWRRDHNSAAACIRLAELSANPTLPGIRKDPARARELYTRACMLQLKEACKLAGLPERR